MGGSKSYGFLVVLSILAVHVFVVSSTPVDFIPMETGCLGSIDECLTGFDDEFAVDSESNRRILATRRYISYGALRRNTVPCSRRGASYYNCRAGARANPYTRGCSRITRCRR
uniref:Protein RALF-like 33 n=1 Tax=Rhizophora mucronata TaxID=61149 RepID=A0A2P2LAG9_RHIMU